MIGYPITYGDTLEKSNGFTSETVLTGISEYWSNEENRANFNRGYKFGLVVFGISGVLVRSTAAFASDNGVLPINNGANGGGSCPGTGSPPSFYQLVVKIRRIGLFNLLIDYLSLNFKNEIT